MAINFNEIPAVAAQGLTRLITDYGNMARQKAEQDRAMNEYLARTAYNAGSNVLGGLADISGNAFMSGANSIGGTPELLWNSTLGRKGAGLETLARQAADADYYGAGMKRGLDRILNPFSPTPYTPAETIVNAASMIPAAGTAIKGASNVANAINTGVKAVSKQKALLSNAIKSAEQSAAKAAGLADEVNDLRKLQGSIADIKDAYIKRGASEPAMWREGGDVAKTAQMNYLTGQSSKKALPSTLKKYNKALDDVNARIAQGEKTMTKATGQTSKLEKQAAAQAAAYDSAAGQALDDVLTAFGEAGSTVIPKVLLGAAGSGLSGQIANMLKDGEPVNLEPIIQNRERNINVHNRPIVRNRDGSISTLRSMSINDGGAETLIPTISRFGIPLTPSEAVAEYAATGKHLGRYATPELATAAAKALSENQADFYKYGYPNFNYISGQWEAATPPTESTATPTATPRDVNGVLDQWNDAVLSKAMSGLPTPEARVVEAAQPTPTPTRTGSPLYNYLEARPNVITPTQRLVQESQGTDLTNLPSYKKLQEIAANAKTQEEVINQLTKDKLARQKVLADESDNSVMRWIGHILTLPFTLRRGESPALTWARTQAGIEANDAELSAINRQLAAAAGLPTELGLAQAVNAANVEALTKSADIQSKKDKSYLQSLLAEANAQKASAIEESNSAKNQLAQERIRLERQELANKEKELVQKRIDSIKKTLDEAINLFKISNGSVNYLPPDSTLIAEAKELGLDPDYFVLRKHNALLEDSSGNGNKLLSSSNMTSANKASVFSK